MVGGNCTICGGCVIGTLRSVLSLLAGICTVRPAPDGDWSSAVAAAAGGNCSCCCWLSAPFGVSLLLAALSQEAIRLGMYDDILLVIFCTNDCKQFMV